MTPADLHLKILLSFLVSLNQWCLSILSHGLDGQCPVHPWARSNAYIGAAGTYPAMQRDGGRVAPNMAPQGKEALSDPGGVGRRYGSTPTWPLVGKGCGPGLNQPCGGGRGSGPSPLWGMGCGLA